MSTDTQTQRSYDSYTEVAQEVLKRFLSQTQLTSPLTGKAVSLKISDLKTTTGGFWGNEEFSIYLESPQLHDLGVNNVGNAIQKMMMTIPFIAEHFNYEIQGVPGIELRKQVEKALQQAGVATETAAQILAWEGFNDKTSFPEVLVFANDERVELSIRPELHPDAKAPADDRSPVKPDAKDSPFKHLAVDIEARHDAINASLVRRAEQMKGADGTPVFTAEEIGKLKAEKLIISDSQYAVSGGGNLSFYIGQPVAQAELDKLKAQRADKQLPEGMQEISDREKIGKTVLSKLKGDAIKDLLLDAIIENVPSVYGVIADASRVAQDIKTLAGDKVDVSTILHHTQLKKDHGGLMLFDPNSREKQSASITALPGLEHTNTVQIRYLVPKGMRATDITRAILEFGALQGLLPEAVSDKRPIPAAAALLVNETASGDRGTSEPTKQPASPVPPAPSSQVGDRGWAGNMLSEIGIQL